jgi:hypothetical protein
MGQVFIALFIIADAQGAPILHLSLLLAVRTMNTAGKSCFSPEILHISRAQPWYGMAEWTVKELAENTVNLTTREGIWVHHGVQVRF